MKKGRIREWTQRPFEALTALPLKLFPMHPLASAIWIVTTIVTATAPINPNAITMAIITLDAVVRPSFEEAMVCFNKIFYKSIPIIGP
jgi:hypothetical protein